MPFSSGRTGQLAGYTRSTAGSRRKLLSAFTASLLCVSAVTNISYASDDYPNRPIRVVFGFAAGGGTDAVVRAISAKLGEELGVSVVVENKPGANANIAGEQVSRAAADGYTLLYNTSSIVLSPHLYAKLNYDLTKDLTPIAVTANIPLVMAASPDVPAANIQEFVEYLKSRNGSADFASSSSGNITHLAAVSFLDAVDAQAVHIPYKSEAPALTDLIGGRVHFYFGNANALIPMVQAGKVKGMAVTTAERIPMLPDVPTLSETVAPGMEFGAWSGFMAPAGTPEPIIAKLSSALERTMNDPELRKRIEGTGAQPKYSKPEEYKAFMKSELERWGEIVRTAGIQPG